jgi:hypothetical protein
VTSVQLKSKMQAEGECASGSEKSRNEISTSHEGKTEIDVRCDLNFMTRIFSRNYATANFSLDVLINEL